MTLLNVGLAISFGIQVKYEEIIESGSVWQLIPDEIILI